MPPITDARAPALTIGELSRQTGVNVETIRYYERVQMLPAPPEPPAGVAPTAHHTGAR
jgi:MerR family transcriptional regulator, mercuric resistance operon regulatory protein